MEGGGWRVEVEVEVEEGGKEGRRENKNSGDVKI